MAFLKKYWLWLLLGAGGLYFFGPALMSKLQGMGGQPPYLPPPPTATPGTPPPSGIGGWLSGGMSSSDARAVAMEQERTKREALARQQETEIAKAGFGLAGSLASTIQGSSETLGGWLS